MMVTNDYGDAVVLGLVIGLPSLLPCLNPPCCVSFSEALPRRCISLLVPYKDSRYCCRGAVIVILPMKRELRKGDDVEGGGLR